MSDTIFALSSGSPPAAIGVIRISGPAAAVALTALAGPLPKSRRATYRVLRDPDSGEELDRALVLWLPGPATATGEDSAELHCHGGRAVIAAVCAALARIDGLRAAGPGDFTRRAFANGRIDLAEAEGLADLLTAETELQRRAAQVMATGGLSRIVEHWREAVLDLSAKIEAVLDFSDEGEVGEGMPATFARDCARLLDELGEWLAKPRAEPLREGFRVVLAGPPNAGKSTLFNALVEHEAAITAAEPGTTRDVLTRVGGDRRHRADVCRHGWPARSRCGSGGNHRYRAGSRSGCRGRPGAVARAGGRGTRSHRADRNCRAERPFGSAAQVTGAISVSAVTGEGMNTLRVRIVREARSRLPRPGEAALNARQHRWIGAARTALAEAAVTSDPIITAENLRAARWAIDALVGRTGTEAMLDTIFGRFCIGK